MRRCLVAIPLLFPVAATGQTPADESPGLEMLEYLGTWNEDDEEWIDPMSMYRSGLLGTLPEPAGGQREPEKRKKP